SWLSCPGSPSPICLPDERLQAAGSGSAGGRTSPSRRDWKRVVSTSRTEPAPLRLHDAHDGARLRVFLWTNERDRDHAAGQRDAFARLESGGAIEALASTAPKVMALTTGEPARLRDVA